MIFRDVTVYSLLSSDKTNNKTSSEKLYESNQLNYELLQQNKYQDKYKETQKNNYL